MEKVNRRILWLDLIKVIAVFMMIAVHCTDNVTPAERFEPWYNLWGSLYGSFMRPAIPLFVMVTGALLLPVRQDMHTFYKKRLLRVVVPFLFWSVLYNLFPWITGILGFSPSVINDFFAWAEPSQELGDALHNIAMIPFNFSSFAIQMWYVYLLIGLYLYLPIFSAWVSRASEKEQRFFLIIWFVTLFIPYIRQYLTNDLWGTCSWNEFGMLYYFAGFNGYLLLGYYLTHHTIKISRPVMYSLSAIMFAAGYCVTFFGFKSITSVPGQPVELVELFYTYCSPNVLFMALPVFLLIQNIKSVGSVSGSAVESLSKCTLGIWMSHYMFLGPCYMFVGSLPIHTMLKMIVSSVLLLAVTWGFVAAVRRTGSFGKWIMG